MFISYDKSLITIDNDDIYGEGPSTSVVHSVDVRRDGVVALAWADANGFQEGSGPDRRPPESGTIAVITCVANEDLDTSDFASFNIVDDGELDTFFDTINNQEVTVAISNLTLPVLVPSSVLIYTEESEVAAPYAGWDSTALEPTPGKTSFEYEVLATDDEGNIISYPTVTWAIDGNPAGVSVENGIVTIDSTTAAGEYTVKATVGEQSAESKFTVTKETSVPTNIVGDQPGAESDTNLYIPADNGESNTVQFSGKVWDQYGVAMSSDLLDWKLEPSDIAGVSISDTGLLTITNEAKGAITDTTGKQFTVKGTCGEMSLTTTVTVKRAAPVATSVAIYKDETAISSDTIAIPQNGSTNVTYTAKVLDQYGSEMAGAVAWSTEGDVPSSVTVSDGTVTVSAGASTGSFSLKATSGSVSGSVSISVASISFGDEDAIKNALTISGTPTYGMTWGEIVQVTGKISANVGGTPVDGTYSVKAADTNPDAGEQTYTIVFNGSGYTDVTVYTGNVTIAPKAVTVTGITVGDKEYDGNNTATVNYTEEGVSVTGTIGEDVVTVTGATGMFADANAGTDKTVTVEVTLSDGNYTVEDLKLEADITPVTLTDINTENITVTKEYDASTSAGTLTGEVTFSGKVGEDDVSVTAVPSAYADANVGYGKTVTLALSLTGDDSGNYTLGSTTTVTFNNAAITVCDDITDTTSKTQNVVVGVGTFTEPSFTGVNGEAVTGTTTYTYNSSTMDKTAIATELAALTAGDTATISYSFTASGNYSGTKTGEITVTMVDIAFKGVDEAITVASDAVYGDTWADIVTVDASKIDAAVGDVEVEGTYSVENSNDRPNAGTANYKVLFNSNDGRYVNVEVVTGTVTVAKKPVSITGLDVADKTYDGNTSANVSGTATLDGVLTGDTVSVAAGTASFADKNVGTEKNVIFRDYSLSGTDANNYELSAQPSATANITAKPVTITGVAAANKTYDGTTMAQITGTAVISGKVGDDDVEVVNGTAAFADANVGNVISITFSGFSLSGADACNYELTAQPVSVTANITKADYTNAPELNINIIMNQADAQTGTLTALNFFGGNMPAEATITNVVLDSVDNSIIESISVDNGSLAYSSATNITTEGTVETYNVTISTRNYNDITATLTFTTVAKTPVTISGVSVADKVYNGQAVSYIGTPTAAANGETVEVSAYTYTWQNAEGNVLSAAPVNAGSYKLVIAVAADDPNYVGSATVSFTISKATVTVTVDDKEAYVGSDMPELTYTVSGLASGESLAVNPTLTCNADMDKPGEYAYYCFRCGCSRNRQL